MGICKCRNKTDLFCWHCQKAVCFNCITDEEHKTSYVGTYTEWLENQQAPPPICPLSQKPFTGGDEVIRFMNLSIFLLSAIDEYGRSKPDNTALAGFTIPGTNIPMVPLPDDRSKLAQQIREKLSRFPWISGMITLQKEVAENLKMKPTSPVFREPLVMVAGSNPTSLITDKSGQDIDSNYTTDPLLSMSQSTILSRKVASTTSPNKAPRPPSLEHTIDLLESPSTKTTPYIPTRYSEEDADDNKYKRRPIEMEALGFTIPAQTGPVAPGYHIYGKRMLLLLALLTTLLVVLFLSMNLDEDTTVPFYEGLEEVAGILPTPNQTLPVE